MFWQGLLFLVFLATLDVSTAENWETPTFKYYFHTENKETWDKAEQICEDMGGFLVIISNALEDKYVLKKCGNTCWLGGRIKKGTDEQSRRNEKLFKWIDNSSMEYTNWKKDEPINNGRKYDCMRMDKNGWSTSKCDRKYHFACKKLA